MFHLPSFVAGAVFLAFLLAFVLPDKWSTWFVLRKNAPKWFLFPAVGAFGLGLVILDLGYGRALIDILARVRFERWVWIFLYGGLVATLVCILLIRMGKRNDKKPVKPGS